MSALASTDTVGRWVVKGDLFNVESLKEAIKGSDLDPCITIRGDELLGSVCVPWHDTPNGIGELTQGKNIVHAAKAVGVKFFVWSGLPSSTKLSNGKYSTVYHIETKAGVWEYLKASGIPHAAVDTGYFADNLWKFGAMKEVESGKYAIEIPKYSPTSTQTFTWVADIGKAVVGLLRNYNDPAKSASVLGKAFPVVTGILSYPKIATKISKVIGKEVTFTPLETSGLEELDVMYAYQSDIDMYKDTPVPNPDLVALGVKLGDIDELIATEIVTRFT